MTYRITVLIRMKFSFLLEVELADRNMYAPGLLKILFTYSSIISNGEVVPTLLVHEAGEIVRSWRTKAAEVTKGVRRSVSGS